MSNAFFENIRRYCTYDNEYDIEYDKWLTYVIQAKNILPNNVHANLGNLSIKI